MTEHPEALPLEQSCIEPGHWLIEGYDVITVRLDGGRPGKSERWLIKFRGKRVKAVRTLAEARDYIRGVTR